MQRSKIGEEQIIILLKQAEAGVKVAELCRQHGIPDPTFYKWRFEYGTWRFGSNR